MIGRKSTKKLMKFTMILTIMIFIGLAIRIGYIQFIDGDMLTRKAYDQQTSDRKVNPRRGTIYDNTGKTILAVSSTVETVTINPMRIKKEDKEKVAKKLSELFKLDYEKTLKKVNKRASIENIAKKIEKDKANELRKWMLENNITEGINIDEDTKRYYPYNNLASQIIGFCGSDSQGLNGIESKYEEYLKGKKGSISRITDASGKVIKNTSEEYNEPTDGDDIILTINATIQGIAEKYLKEACIDNKCTDGGNVIIMNPQNGEILAIAGYPDYNLNDPFAVDETLSKEEQNKRMQMLWRNKAISDTYEPGSTFKLVTASAALQEGISIQTELSVKQNLYNFLIKYAMKQLEQGISKERIIKNIDNAIFNTTYSNVVVFEGGKAIESFEMIDLRNEIVEEIQNKNVKIKEERD